jgi:hypothetical protein
MERIREREREWRGVAAGAMIGTTRLPDRHETEAAQPQSQYCGRNDAALPIPTRERKVRRGLRINVRENLV